MVDRLEKALEKARKQREAELRNPVSAPVVHNPVSPLAAAPASMPAGGSVKINEEHLQQYRIVAQRLRSKEADVFRILRTQILNVMSQSGFKTLAITSPNYSDGKTTIALNLAVSIAMDLKQTVLLADLDLRKPGINSYLGIDAPYGLSDYLINNTPIAQCMVRTSFERLTILPAGSALDNSSEVLGSPKMAALANDLKSRYADRIVIYDMPPALAQDDPIAFLPHVDTVLMVVNDGVTTIAELKQSMHAMSQANIIGTVLNHSRKRRPPGDKGNIFERMINTLIPQQPDIQQRL